MVVKKNSTNPKVSSLLIQEKMFDFDTYKKIVLQHRKDCATFKEVLSNKPNRFSLIRHDVEFSPRRALRLAEIDSDLSVSSTFFFKSEIMPIISFPMKILTYLIASKT